MILKNIVDNDYHYHYQIGNLFKWIGESMTKTLHVTSKGKGFIVHFQNSHIYLCIHQMIELLRNICREDRHVFELGFFHFLQGMPNDAGSNIEYRIYIGRLYLLLSEKEIVEFWKNEKNRY